jgi:hypothetical protein
VRYGSVVAFGQESGQRILILSGPRLATKPLPEPTERWSNIRDGFPAGAVHQLLPSLDDLCVRERVSGQRHVAADGGTHFLAERSRSVGLKDVMTFDARQRMVRAPQNGAPYEECASAAVRVRCVC